MAKHRSPLVIEAFLLQSRNIRLFIPVFVITIAYTILSTLGYSTFVQPLLSKVSRHARNLWLANPAWPDYAYRVAEARVHVGYLVAAGTAYLLIATLTTGPAVLAVAVSAAVTACSGDRRSSPSFHALVRRALAGGHGLKGPFGTALLGNGIVHGVACRGAIFVLQFSIVFFVTYRRPVFLSMEFFIFLLGLLAHLFAIYVEVICTLAVVVSAAEPAGCICGARALQQAWWIVAEKTTPAVILVFVKGAVKAVNEMVVSIGVQVYMYPYHYYYNTVAYAILSGFLCAALQLWFVCATTIYYYQCRQRKDGRRYRI